jgi:Tol biopolymer transport system component
MRRTRLVTAGTVAIMAVVLGGCVLTPWHSELVTAGAAGTGLGGHSPSSVTFSPDGTKIAFDDVSAGFGPTDTNGAEDVYVRDLTTGTTALISANASGTDSGDDASVDPVFSPDGTKIAFESDADDLGPTDTNAASDIYVRDLTTGTTTLVSADASGTDSGDGASIGPVFSPDGTKIAFNSVADDLGPTDTNFCSFLVSSGPCSDVYLRDLTTGTTSLVSENVAGTDSGDWHSNDPFFSPDGTKIAFYSAALNLAVPAPSAPPRIENVYVRDLSAGSTSLVSVSADGNGGGDSHSRSGPFSADGTKVAFTSQATNLGPVDTNGVQDVYVRDLSTGATSLVSGGSGGANGPIFSQTGLKVAFTEANDVYVRDLVAGTTTLVSVNAAGTGGGNDRSFEPVFSPDGKQIAFSSNANDLGPTDTNTGTCPPIGDCTDIYLRDVAAGNITLISGNADGTDSANDSSHSPVYSPTGQAIAFVSRGSNFGPTDTNFNPDVYVARPPRRAS